MIKLKNVSKFYYSKGVIATGITKVSLEFKLGEFVAITGESGSGKSTLLNVISGLDTYEEGEMYVNGGETSHYLAKDWEEYRRKNIGNIYQNFNLINSYTVYQNIDLVLSLNGVSLKERKAKILALLQKVDMVKYKNTKVSKLSGGQRQRVAIARALAKDTPIIIADEPTGNLDKKSASNIIALLKEIASDKLVIIVTHNYEQVSDYVTRKITMADGRIVEDNILKQSNIKESVSGRNYKNMNLFESIRLGVRNTFNVTAKFLLLFLVYAFVVSSLMGEYSFFKQNEYEASRGGYNFAFRDTNDKRIVMNKTDKTPFTEEELNKLRNNKSIKSVVLNDVALDQYVSFESENNGMWFSGVVYNNKEIKKVDYGRLPKADNEIVVSTNDEYYFGDERDTYINSKVYLVDDNTGMISKDKEYIIVGIIYDEEDELFSIVDNKFYVSDVVLKDVLMQTHEMYSKVTVDFMGTNYVMGESYLFKIKTNNRVNTGKAYISEDYDWYCDKNNCLNKQFTIGVKNMYYEDSKVLTIEKKYNKKNISSLLELPGYDSSRYDESYNGVIYINPDDYNQLFNKDSYQVSVYAKDIEEVDKLGEELEKEGYNVLLIKDTLVNDQTVQFLKIFKLIVTIILVVALLFIAYFIIKIILKSRNVYFSIIRMLGASRNVCRRLLIIELFTVQNISYFLFLIVARMNALGYINVNFIDVVNRYFKLNDYVILYLILTFMSLIISFRYSRKIFKSSAMNTYREEV